MMIYLFIVIGLLLGNCTKTKSKYDLTIIGTLDFSKGLARFPIGIIHTLKNYLNINFIPSFPKHADNIPSEVENYINRQDNSVPGNVGILTDVLWLKQPEFNNIFKKMPSKCKIKIAYSMFESSKIPYQWATILNLKFDAVVVPDNFFVDVYKNSGVKIPIFVLPMGLFLNEFLKRPPKTHCNKPFIFGCSAVFWERKNIHLLIGAFIKAFRNKPDVILKIHTNGLFGIEKFKKLIQQKKITNIKIISSNLPLKNYIDLLSTFDCYVLLSKGEGFSITPREALALGIPCILSNNTAQKTICKTGYVYGVNSLIKEPAFNSLVNDFCGDQYNCKIDDVCKALLNVYTHYNLYLEKARKGRIWVKQYSFENLKRKYMNLIRPKKVILGNENKITNEFLMTNSMQLYKKYLKLQHP